MDIPDLYTALMALFSILGTGIGVFITVPYIKDIVGAANSDFIRIAAGAFTGSSSAGIIYLYLRERISNLPLIFTKNHVIVCGLNFRSLLMIQDLVREGKKPVIIEPDAQNPLVETCRSMKLILITGDPADGEILRRAKIFRARYILCVNDSDETNAEIALRCQDICKTGRKTPLTCIIQIISPQLYGMIRSRSYTAGSDGQVRIEFFNQYAVGARLLLERFPGFPAAGSGDERDPAPILIVGGGRLGETLLLRIARTWYGRERTGKKQLKIFLLDTNARSLCDNILFSFPLMKKSCELIPVPLDVHSTAFQRGMFLSDPSFDKGLLAYICLDDDSSGLYAALALQHLAAGREVRIVVRMDHNTSVARLVGDGDTSPGALRQIQPVNLFELTASGSYILSGEREILARAIHENYCLNQKNLGMSPATNPLLVSWDGLGTLTEKNAGVNGEHYRDSNRRQADFIWTKLALAGCEIGPVTDWDAPFTFRFTPDETEYLSRLEHGRWTGEKIAEGWKYGSVRDDTEKVHPSLVPYDDLSEPEKEKDRDTIRQIPAILSLIDFQVSRRTNEPASHASSGQAALQPGT